MEKASINLLSLTQWRVNHQKLLSEDRPKFLTNDDENNYSDVRLSVNYKISVNEIKKGMKNMKNGRPTGPGGFSIELIMAQNNY